MHDPTGGEASETGTSRPLSTGLRNPLPNRTIHTANRQAEEKPNPDFRTRSTNTVQDGFPHDSCPCHSTDLGTVKAAFTPPSSGQRTEHSTGAPNAEKRWRNPVLR
jgi:hypothetical protein